MSRYLLALLTCAALHAAAIRGTVVEKQTGKPLARALVVIHPVAGSGGATASVRTGRHGEFEFPALPAGSYLVTASKTGFGSAEYGQKGWSSAGTPVVLGESGVMEMRLWLPHFGAIGGRVIDGNSVGMANCTVYAYRDTQPPELAGHSTTDDRGAFRISGLTAGAYLARTAAIDESVGVYLPTFSRESLTVGGAIAAGAVLDQDTLFADIRPIGGRLATVSGRVSSPGAGRMPAVVTLVSDMGPVSQIPGADGRFAFERVAPGPYDIYGQAADADSPRRLAAWRRIEVSGDRVEVALDLAPLPSVQFSFLDTSGRRVDPIGLPFLLRRVELFGPGQPEYLRLDPDGSARLDSGRWEVALGPDASWYLARGSSAGAQASGGGASGWKGIAVAPGNAPLAVDVVLSPHPGKLRGAVTIGGQPASGAPVYLEAVDPASGSRWGDLRSTRAGVDGRYSFAGLAPGLYRVLSTFEYQAPEPAAMIRAGAREVKIEEGLEADRDLELWVMP